MCFEISKHLTYLELYFSNNPPASLAAPQQLCNVKMICSAKEGCPRYRSAGKNIQCFCVLGE